MVVGVSPAFSDSTILWPALAIGMATLTMVTLGLSIGRRFGAVVGKRAEICSGLVLIALVASHCRNICSDAGLQAVLLG